MLEKKYDHNIEKKWQNFWEENNIYKFEESSSKRIYTIDSPPPTVSGSLHIGHVFSYTQSEIIARYQRMQGKNVYFPIGFDDNGLPTERLIEKELKINSREIMKDENKEKCLNLIQSYEKDFRDLWKSIGFSMDWTLQYETISSEVQKISQKSFLDLFIAGKLYNQEKPVLWCTNCQTSIAQAELEAKETESSFNYIIFKAEDTDLIIATTRPELLYGCVCLFINPKDKRYNKFIGHKAIVPIYEYEIPIYGDERVDIQKGTGIVMCATFGDSTDLEWFNEYNLPMRKVIEKDGRITAETPYIAGLSVYDARKIIIDILKEKRLLIKSEKIFHTVNIHERCGHEIEILLSKQWYIDILKEKEKLLEAGNNINWYPPSMKNKYETWVSNLKWDWCISRQRYFGIPLPVWYCSNCGKTIVASEDMLPIDPKIDYPRNICSCGCKSFIPELSVLDTWATSSLTPYINSSKAREKGVESEFIPMSLRTQAHEIIRTWAFYTIVKSLYHSDQLPWKDIMISGFVLAKKGEKISKSKNNSSLVPKTLIEKHSADAIRYWTAEARLGTDTTFGEEDLNSAKRFITKLWNSSRFALMHLQDYKADADMKSNPIDEWISERLKQVTQNAKLYLDKYEIGLARQEIDDFFWKDFCDNYIELVKDRLYKPEIHGYLERRGAQDTIYKILLGILKLYAIYVPHVTEEIYQDFFIDKEKMKSIHHHVWDTQAIDNKSVIEFGNKVLKILSYVRRYKTESNLSMRAEIKKLTITATKERELTQFKESLKDIIACTSAENIVLKLGVEFEILIEN